MYKYYVWVDIGECNKRLCACSFSSPFNIFLQSPIGFSYYSFRYQPLPPGSLIEITYSRGFTRCYCQPYWFHRVRFSSRKPNERFNNLLKIVSYAIFLFFLFLEKRGDFSSTAEGYVSEVVDAVLRCMFFLIRHRWSGIEHGSFPRPT